MTYESGIENPSQDLVYRAVKTLPLAAAYFSITLHQGPADPPKDGESITAYLSECSDRRIIPFSLLALSFRENIGRYVADLPIFSIPPEVPLDAFSSGTFDPYLHGGKWQRICITSERGIKEPQERAMEIVKEVLLPSLLWDGYEIEKGGFSLNAQGVYHRLVIQGHSIMEEGKIKLFTLPVEEKRSLDAQLHRWFRALAEKV